MTLLMPREVDALLRYPRGRSLKLAKDGRLPFIRLPDDEVRFDEAEILRFLEQRAQQDRGFPRLSPSTPAPSRRWAVHCHRKQLRFCPTCAIC
jgi:glutathione S-transferase